LAILITFFTLHIHRPFSERPSVNLLLDLATGGGDRHDGVEFGAFNTFARATTAREEDIFRGVGHKKSTRFSCFNAAGESYRILWASPGPKSLAADPRSGATIKNRSNPQSFRLIGLLFVLTGRAHPIFL